MKAAASSAQEVRVLPPYLPVEEVAGAIGWSCRRLRCMLKPAGVMTTVPGRKRLCVSTRLLQSRLPELHESLLVWHRESVWKAENDF